MTLIIILKDKSDNIVVILTIFADKHEYTISNTPIKCSAIEIIIYFDEIHDPTHTKNGHEKNIINQATKAITKEFTEKNAIGRIKTKEEAYIISNTVSRMSSNDSYLFDFFRLFIFSPFKL